MESASGASAQRRWPLVASAVLAVIGLVDSLYLTLVKWNFAADPSYDGGMCGLGGGCDQLQRSVMGEIPFGAGPGLPVALLAVGFYVVWFVLLVMRAKSPPGDARRPVIGRVQLGLALLANVYTLVLLGYSLSVGQFCPFCAVLYVTNLGLAIVTYLDLEEGFGAFVRRAASAIPTAVSAVAFVVFLAAVGASFFVYRTTLAGTVVAKAPDPTTTPGAKVHTFQTAGRAERGPASARIRIVEFADFECPHCRSLFHTLEEVVEKYPDDLHLTFLHFPLDKACNRAVPKEFHQRACELATIAECARRQGRFFEAAKLLFDAGDTDTKTLLDAVAALGADRAQLEACMADAAAVAAVKSDIEQGLGVGVEGTPAVYMNGVEVGGARPREFFEAIIDKHLAGPPPAKP